MRIYIPLERILKERRYVDDAEIARKIRRGKEIEDERAKKNRRGEKIEEEKTETRCSKIKKTARGQSKRVEK